MCTCCLSKRISNHQNKKKPGKLYPTHTGSQTENVVKKLGNRLQLYTLILLYILTLIYWKSCSPLTGAQNFMSFQKRPYYNVLYTSPAGGQTRLIPRCQTDDIIPFLCCRIHRLLSTLSRIQWCIVPKLKDRQTRFHTRIYNVVKLFGWSTTVTVWRKDDNNVLY